MSGLAYIDLRIRWAVVRARLHGLNPDDEFRGLYISEEQVDALLGGELGNNLWPSPNGNMPELAQWPTIIERARQDWLSSISAGKVSSSPLSRFIQEFELTAEELDILLLVLAPELEPRYERLFAYLQDDVTKKRPTINLILDLLTDCFQEKVTLQGLFSDAQTLIRERLLIHFTDNNQYESNLLAQYIRPAVSVRSCLLGQKNIDAELNNIANLIETSKPVEASELAHLPLAQAANMLPHNPLLGFIGSYGTGKWKMAYYLASEAGRPLLHVRMGYLARSNMGLSDGMKLIQRDGRLHQAILYLDQWDKLLEENQPDADLMKALLNYPYPVITAGEQAWQPRYRIRKRPVFQLTFDVPVYEERLRIWQHYLYQLAFIESETIDCTALATHFRLTPGQIRDVVITARDLALWQQEGLEASHLLAASRIHSNQKLSTLATKIIPHYTWEDIVLPHDSLAQLHEMINTMKKQAVVYNNWGFNKKLAIGKGLKALFAGEPGTGKTMSADILACDLGLDLYKIDLSTVVDKYIGETEKNIGCIFDEAATSNAILFFDEADSLFSKRSEVKDSHDRYANIQTGYLLQRMESFDGVVILATNLRSNIDEAFTRRLHFLVEFPFPEAADRERIWKVTFPPQTPIDKEVDFHLLAERFRLAGGNIRNIVLAAAFLAAKEEENVRMTHILHAVRREYQKMGRLINEKLFTWP